MVGLDFAFSAPLWFLQQLGIGSAPELWEHVSRHGEAWLKACEPPWWGRPGRQRPLQTEHYRQTERQLHALGVRPKSVFQIGGAGAVGTGSIRGMPLLLKLQRGGASVWPFDPPGWPLVLEIYPRLLTGAVAKSRPAAREAYLALHWPQLPRWHIRTEDAFDAAVSAVVMAQHAQQFQRLPNEHDPVAKLEGRIWHPEGLNWPNSGHHAGAANGG